MNIKILIVDDEFLERTLIRHGNDWEANGFEIIGEADSGRSALEAIQVNQPDIVFTDISMPFMDGLELTTQLQARYPAIKVVIITGYREFEYARRALKLGVTEFILKPIQHEEVLKAGQELKKQIIEERFRQEEIREMREQIIESIPLKKEKFLRKLVGGSLRLESKPEMLEKYDLHFLKEGVFCCTIKLKIKDLETNLQVVNGQAFFENVNSELVRFKKNVSIAMNYSEIVILIGDQLSVDEIKREWETIYKSLKEKFPMEMTIGISKRYQNSQCVNEAYSESKKTLELGIVYDKYPIHHITDFEILDTEGNEFLEMDWSSFEMYVKNGVRNKSLEFVSQYFETIRGMKYRSLSAVRMLTMHVVTHTLIVLRDMGKGLDDVFDESDSIYYSIASKESLNELEDCINSFLSKIIDFVLNSRKKQIHHLAEGAKTYIDENLSSYELSLKVIASHLFTNSSYLSRKFKQEYGVSITEYITKERIKWSLEYLNKSNLKAYEIAEKVGIKDAHYFSQCFKKVMGVSVKDYKNRKVK